jgi:hypothetical protein
MLVHDRRCRIVQTIVTGESSRTLERRPEWGIGDREALVCGMWNWLVAAVPLAAGGCFPLHLRIIPELLEPRNGHLFWRCPPPSSTGARTSGSTYRALSPTIRPSQGPIARWRALRALAYTSSILRPPRWLLRQCANRPSMKMRRRSTRKAPKVIHELSGAGGQITHRGPVWLWRGGAVSNAADRDVVPYFHHM